MPTTINTSSPSTAATGLGHVPRAVWVGGGALALVTAGMAGALIGKSAPPAASLPAPVAMTAPSTPPGHMAYAPVLQDGVPTPTNTIAPTTPTVAPVPATAKAANPAPAPARAATGTRHADARQTSHAAACVSCGTVEASEPVRVKGQGTGLGAVAGGVLGGVVGHQVGGGNGKTAMTVLGALGGGLAGNEVERRTRGETLYDVRVRMQDGSHRSIRQGQALAVGSSVVVEGGHVRLARSRTGDGAS